MKLIGIFTLALLLAACEKDNYSERDSYLVTDTASFELLEKEYPGELKRLSDENGQTIFFSSGERIRDLSFSMHQLTDRCGGFFAFDSAEEAKAGILGGIGKKKKLRNPQLNYNMTMTDFIKPLLDEVAPEKISATIAKLSSYKNRYYRSETGVQSQEFLKETWENLNKRGDSFTVEFFDHESWPQPSIIATWKGSELSDQVVVLGGHGDSINMRGFPTRDTEAPGADDNASGVSTITEVIRVLMNSDYNPKRTIKFMAYAAEEVGLRGSRKIAQAFASDKINVVSAMQLDMTNHQAADNTFSFIRDHTNDKLSLFVQKLADEHVDIEWVDDKCGYACSDHASWTAEGFPSVFPFEARFHSMNKKIHTANDTLANSDPTAEHASHFAKLAIAYTIEVAK